MDRLVSGLLCLVILLLGRSLAEHDTQVPADRVLVLQGLLLNQALNTKHLPPEESEEYKVVRCYQVPGKVACYRSPVGEEWNRCETVMERQCYLYTYTLNSQY